MEKPGSRPADPRQLIINTPQLLRKRDRWTLLGVTLFFWGLLIYLLQPLLSFLAWVVDIYVFRNQMIELGGYRSFVDNALHYLLVIMLMDLLFLLWARSNQWRFRGKNRRGPVPDATLEAQADFFAVNPEALKTWRTFRRARVHFDEQGAITGAEPL